MRQCRWKKADTCLGYIEETQNFNEYSGSKIFKGLSVEVVLMIKKINEQIAIYQTPNGALQLKADTNSETIWASLTQIASLFGTDKSGISRHIKNIYQSRELNKKGTVANFATVQKESQKVHLKIKIK